MIKKTTCEKITKIKTGPSASPTPGLADAGGLFKSLNISLLILGNVCLIVMSEILVSKPTSVSLQYSRHVQNLKHYIVQNWE